jgi:hypothetical protein
VLPASSAQEHNRSLEIYARMYKSDREQLMVKSETFGSELIRTATDFERLLKRELGQR